MKIRSLRLFDYNQFKDITIELVYPEGHTKAGEPLDKICFIGQSGTGKTTILNFISSILRSKGSLSSLKYHAAFSYYNKVMLINSSSNGVSPTYSITSKTGSGTEVLRTNQQLELVNQYFSNPEKLSMYLPADFLSNNKGDSESLINDGRNFYDFKDVNIRNIWYKILDEVKEHQKTVIELKDALEEIHKKSNKTIEEIRKEREPIENKLSQLEKEDTNPLKKLAANYLDIVLANFNLKVDTELSVSENLDSIEYIRIKDKNGKTIPNGFLSTGTSQFLLSSLPFYLLKPKDAIVLFDEPERSLYPNIQKLLVDHYAKFAPNCQFIYATHSPIIASCFDPWEVVELRFNDEGFIEQKRYNDGVNHVDNYTVHPKYLTYELILKEIFDVPDTEGDERERKYTELVMLENELKQFKENGDNESEGFLETLKRYKEIANLLSWEVKYN